MNKFESELESLINRHSIENESGTPDFILATYIRNCLDAFSIAVRHRSKWYGVKDKEFTPKKRFPSDSL